VANYIKAVYQVHFIVTSHNTDIINAILDKRYISLTQDALGRADIITAVSKNTREHLLKVFGRGHYSLARKTRVVPCGVDTKMFPSRGDVSAVNKKYHLTDKKVVLYSGKITSIKGVDVFLRAAQKIKDAIFVVMGDGEEIGVMKKFVSEHKLDNVVFTGYFGSEQRSLMAAMYRRADVLAVPSTVSEGIPLSALEAMSSGTPVVASNIGGIPTVVKNMRNGILVKPKSASALVEGINKLLGNPKLSERFAAKARQDAHEKYDWRVITRKMEKYYEVAYERSRRNRATKRPSFVSEEEYRESKDLAAKKKKL
jgi:glycosyltransferase involved in cell wall biosynthesis